MTETEWVEHQSTPLTVAELRAAIADLPDDMVVMTVCPEDGEHLRQTIINVVSTEVRATQYDQMATQRLLLQASWPTGQYQRQTADPH